MKVVQPCELALYRGSSPPGSCKSKARRRNDRSPSEVSTAGCFVVEKVSVGERQREVEGRLEPSNPFLVVELRNTVIW